MTLYKWLDRRDERDGRSIPDCTRRQLESGEEVKRTIGTRTCVISDYDHAKTIYTPKNMYVQNKLSEYSNNLWGNVTREDLGREAKVYRRQWQSLDGTDKAVWEYVSRCHLARWHTIKEEVVAKLNKNCYATFFAIPKHLGYWCSAKTIQRWWNSHPTARKYRPNVRPALGQGSKSKQKVYAVSVLDNFGLPRFLPSRACMPPPPCIFYSLYSPRVTHALS